MLKLPQTNRFYGLLLTLLLLLIYANSFNNAFNYDDFHVIVQNPAIKDPGNAWRFFSDPLLGSGLVKETSSYRPLLLLTFTLNYALGGLNVFGYHLVNFFLHALCSVLVFSITFFFLQTGLDGEKWSVKRARWTALFAALIFAVHPVQTESVTYITGRSSLLVSFFLLFAFLSFMHYRVSGAGRRLFWAMGSFTCALMVKETAIALLPILMIFIWLYPLGQGWKKRLFSVAPFLLIAEIYIWMRLQLFAPIQHIAKPLRPLYDHVLTQFRAWVYNLGTLVLPLNLNVDYDFPLSHSLRDPQVLWALVLLASLLLITWRISRARRMVGFFALWFAVNLLPTSSLIPLEDVIADRWLYLPSMGYAVILALAADWLFQRRVVAGSRPVKLIFFFLCLLLVELYGFATVIRNFTWTSYWTLWEDAVEKSPYKGRPHMALGLALNQVGLKKEAIAEFKKTIQLSPDSGEAYLNLGHISIGQGRPEEAIKFFQKAVALKPRLSPGIHDDLGVALLLQGRKREGLEEFRRAIAERPDYPRPYFNLGNFYEKEGDSDRAIDCLEKAVRWEPEFVPAHKALARLYEKKGWKEKARQSSQRALKYAAIGQFISPGQ